MQRAVYLYDQSRFVAYKIGYIASDGNLTAKFPTIQAMSAQLVPKACLHRRLFAA
jgi:hypothetical protein